MSFLPWQSNTLNIYEQRWKVDSSWDISALLPLQSNTLNKCIILSSWVIFWHHHPATLQLNGLNMKKVQMCSHLHICPPQHYKARHSTYVGSWHVESFFKSYTLSPLQNATFNIWTNLTSWVMFEMSFPSPTTKQYVKKKEKRPFEVLSENLNSLDPKM